MVNRVKNMSRSQQKAVFANMDRQQKTSTVEPIHGRVDNPRVVARKRLDGTIVTIESEVYVGYIDLPSGKRVPRYMNHDEAMRWSRETGRSVQRLK